MCFHGSRSSSPRVERACGRSIARSVRLVGMRLVGVRLLWVERHVKLVVRLRVRGAAGKVRTDRVEAKVVTRGCVP